MCIALDAHLRPAEAGGNLRRVRVTMSADVIIKRLVIEQIDSSDWLAVADAVSDDHRAAAIALELAMRKSSGDISLEVEILNRTLAMARADLDEAAITNARKKLAVVARSDAMARFELVRQLAKEGDAESVRAVCTGQLDGFDARIAWPCIEGDPEGLTHYLSSLTKLPVLTYADAGKLAKLDRQHKLRGLDCLSGDRMDPYAVLASIRWWHTQVYNRTLPASEEAEIYYRFQDGAPPLIAQCLLGWAARLCLVIAEGGGGCSVPYALGDYIATLTSKDRASSIEFLFLNRLPSGSPQTAAIMLNLHIVLANLLLSEHATAAYWLAPYHVNAAAEMWTRFSNRKITFAAMFSPDVLEGICHDRTQLCTSACGDPAPPWPTCLIECNALTERAARAVCP